MDKPYTSGQAAALSGVSRSTMKRWDREGFLPAGYVSEKPRTHRRYSLEDIVTAAIAITLLEFGFSKVMVRRVVVLIRGRSPERLAGATLLMRLGADQGKPELIMADRYKGIEVEASVNEGAVFVMHLEDLVNRVTEGVRARFNEGTVN